MTLFQSHRRMSAAMLALTAILMAALTSGQADEPARKKGEKEKSSSLKEETITRTRDMRFGEILVVTKKGIEIYNTTGLNDCPPELWNALDVEKIKKDLVLLR
jgi:hypothetical protein